MTNVKYITEVIAEAKNKGITVHFASLMDLRHLKNSELEPQLQKHKGRVVLRGDIVKDDSGSYAVFTAQRMTAAIAMDTISRLPWCAGQAANAASAHTQIKMEDAPSLLKIPKSECPDIWIRLPKHKWPRSWSSKKDPVVASERNLYSHLLTGQLWREQFEKVLPKTVRKKFQIGNVFVNREKNCSCQCVWTI